MNAWGSQYVDKYIRKHQKDNTISYRVFINRHDLKVNEAFETLTKAIDFRDKVLNLCELKRLQKVEKDLDIGEFPYNLIKSLEFEVNEVFDKFEERLNALIKRGVLTEREWFVIEKMYKERCILEEIGKMLDVTRERVRQIQMKAIRKLRYREKYFLIGDYENLEELAKKEYEKFIEEQKVIWTYESASQFIKEHEMEVKNNPTYVMNLTIDELDLSVRSYNCLKRAGIITVEDIVNKEIIGLMKIRNMGRKSLKEIIEVLKKINVTIPNSNVVLPNQYKRQFGNIVRNNIDEEIYFDEIDIEID